MRHVGPLTIVLDFIEASLLSLCYLFIAPIKTLKSVFHISKIVKVSLVLVKQGLLASVLRGLIDLRLGRVDRTITIFESILGALEEYHFDNPLPQTEDVLEWLFANVTLLYLQNGHIDDASLTVIRANKSIGVSKLSGVSNLDVKTAHIVKAGIAAGRLLDENGSATFMVQASELENRRRRRLAQKRKPLSGPATQTGKIIPFPLPQKP